MYHLHIKRNLRTLAFLLVVGFVMTAIGGLWWVNHTGLPESWRATIEREVTKKGTFIHIGSLRYAILQGIVATDVRVYSDAEHQREISRLENVILDIDHLKLARGEFHVNKIQLSDARLLLPVDPKDPTSETLSVTGAYGTIFMPGDHRIEVKDARGQIAGINVSVDARLIAYRHDGSAQQEEEDVGKRRELLARVISELEKWDFDKESPPELRLKVEGDLNDHSSVNAKATLAINDIERNGHILKRVEAEADLAGDILTVTTLRAEDANGDFEGHIDYNLHAREGRFDFTSSLELPALLKSWVGLPSIDYFTIAGKQILEAQGAFTIDERNSPHVHSTGHVRCEDVTLKGIHLDSMEGSFAWRDGDLFVRDAIAVRPDGTAKAKLMIQGSQIQLALNSTLPTDLYKPFFPDHPLEIVLNDFTGRAGKYAHVELEGGFDTNRQHSWAFTGSAHVKNMNYNEVPVNEAKCKFSLNHHELDFYDGTVIFNYSRYPLRQAFSGPTEGKASVGRIRYVSEAKMVEVEKVEGDIWAAPMTRIFAPNVANMLEQYRFHRPPNLKAGGVVDVTPRGRTSLDIAFKSPSSADYVFLGKNLTLAAPSGKVSIRGQRVTVDGLKASTFNGPVAGKFTYSGNGKLAGELTWTKLALPSLASTYDFQLKGGGRTTGRIEFTINNGNVSTMNGEGLLGLEKTELFSVPMFGPLSNLVGNVLNNDRAGYQRAKNAFCTFRIKNGILSSNDFHTSTTSLNFTGEGAVDMKNRTIDMTVRMNARGLLGFITLPLRPFSGLFQFRGTGPLKDPEWESMKFTAPPDKQEEILLAPPRATIVGESGD